MQARLNALYTDNKFSDVTAQTKTDIINTIHLSVDEDERKKFTEAELQEALRYLLTKNAKTNPQVRRLIIRNSEADFILDDPFYFDNDDPLFSYLIANNLRSRHHLHSFFGNRRNDAEGNSNTHSNDCEEGDAIIAAAVCVCMAGACCVCCTSLTYESAESNTVKNLKVAGASTSGLLTFILLTYFLLSNDIAKEFFVDKYDFDVKGYRFLMVLLSSIGGFLVGGTVSTINNIFPCVDTPKFPELSAQAKEALEDLAVIEELLKKGWSHEGDNIKQSDAMIREVIKIYISDLSMTLEVQNDARITVETVEEDLLQNTRRLAR